MMRSLPIFLFFLWLSRVADACPLCFSVKVGNNRIAYQVTTLILMLLPVLLVLGLAWWIRNLLKKN